MEQGSALSNDAAMNGMGAIYNEGDGVPRNVKVARQWFEKAAALGNPEAKQNLREMGRQATFISMASFETPACGGLLRMRSRTLMVRSASSRVSNHEATEWFERTGKRTIDALSNNEIVDPDRKTTHPDAGRMPDRVGDGTGRAGDADFADALDAERVDVGIVLVDQSGHPATARRHSPGRGIPQGWHSRAAGAAVHHGMLVQRERHAPDHAAEELTAHQVRIDDASGGEGADQRG